MVSLNQQYSNHIKKNPLLTRKQEYDLAKKSQNGDLKAREKLIASNYRLVRHVAKKYHRSNINYQDLLQESSIGLIKAVDRFNPDLGYKFSTYATWWIKQAALQYINENLTDIKVPTHSRMLNAKIKETSSTLEKDLGRAPTLEEISSELGESVKKIKYTIKANNNIARLDKENDDSNSTLKDSFADDRIHSNPEQSYLSKELDGIIRNSLSLLTVKEEKILRLRFGITESLDNTKDFPVTEEMSNYLTK